MKDEDDYIMIKIPKKAFSGIYEMTIDNSVTFDNNLPYPNGPYSSFSVRYSSQCLTEVNSIIEKVMFEMAKQKGMEGK